MKALLIRSALMILAFIGVAHASVITFEGATSYSSAIMPYEYGGLVWSGFGVLNQNDYVDTDYSGRSGSGDSYAYNLSGDRRVSISTVNHEFVKLNSAQFSSFIDDELTLIFNGRSQTGDWYQKSIQVGREMALIDFGWKVDKIEIYAISSWGDLISGDPTKFFMDNLTLNEASLTNIPEPSVQFLILAALFAAWSVTKSNKAYLLDSAI